MKEPTKSFEPPLLDASAVAVETFLGHIWSALAATVALTVICCALYPVVVWGIAQALFPAKAGGSLLGKDGAYATGSAPAVGSALLGQSFSAPHYFHPRPSAAGAGYDAANSSGSNLGPLSDKLLNGLTQKDDKGSETLAFDGIRLRTLRYALENGITFKTTVPLDGFKNQDGTMDEVKLVNAFPHAGDRKDKTPLLLGDFSARIPGDAVTASGSGLDPHISPANAALQKARVARARGVSAEAVQKLIDEHTDLPDLGVLGDAGVNVLRLNLALDAAYPVPLAK
jgi:K+-transporting ATPase ATPase C chain